MSHYRCPNETQPISRSIHLGRLARFWPACRECEHRDDTGTISPRTVSQLAETWKRETSPQLFHAEGVAGVCPNELNTAHARRLAVVLGTYLAHQRPLDAEAPVVLLGNDGRALGAELLAAASEGLRWAGCHLVDVGAVSAPCLATAIDHLQADGGVLIGNPAAQSQTVGLKFWALGPRPLSAGAGLDDLEALLPQPIDRPTRTYGSQRSFPAHEPYLANLADAYHALRPLRLVLHTSCPPVAFFLQQLLATVACQAIFCASDEGPQRLGARVVAEGAHFGMAIGDDGETGRLVDQQGRNVPPERLVLLLARQQLSAQPGAKILLDPGTSASVAGVIHAWGGQAVVGAAGRAGTERAMRESGAVLGGGADGRLWHAVGHASPDALRTLTQLLVLLSRSDRRLSEVLDVEVPAK